MAADTVELRPGTIQGSIAFTGATVVNGSVYAYSQDGFSGNSSFTGNTYSLTVAGDKSYRLSIYARLQQTIEDDDSGKASSRFQYVVVYNPEGGFVTGGGWINSPAGAYVADQNLTGKANFGFVSKYQTHRALIPKI